MNELFNMFLDNSIRVGNKHEIIKPADFTVKLSGRNFDYINLPSLQIIKDISIPQEGIANAIVQAQYGIAETGTLVLESRDEKLRVATCLCENLHIVVHISDIIESLEDIAGYLEEQTSAENSYIAFITGASRTADIERVLTIGVHGPRSLTVHIIDEQGGVR